MMACISLNDFLMSFFANESEQRNILGNDYNMYKVYKTGKFAKNFQIRSCQ